MTEKDRILIEKARLADRFDHEYIRSLIPEAKTEECKKELIELERRAFKRCEIRSFDF